jgi:hypothetical protein
MIKIGQTYLINRKKLKEYVKKEWDSEIYNSGIKMIKITSRSPFSRTDNQIYGPIRCWYVEFKGMDENWYLPEDCFSLRKQKLERVLCLK